METHVGSHLEGYRIRDLLEKRKKMKAISSRSEIAISVKSAGECVPILMTPLGGLTEPYIVSSQGSFALLQQTQQELNTAYLRIFSEN